MKILWFSHLVPCPAAERGARQRCDHLVRVPAGFHQMRLPAFLPRRNLKDFSVDSGREFERARRDFRQYCAHGRLLSIPCESPRRGRARPARARSRKITSTGYSMSLPPMSRVNSHSGSWRRPDICLSFLRLGY